MKSVLNERVTVEIDDSEEVAEYEEFEAEFANHLNGVNSEIQTPDESGVEDEEEDEDLVAPIEPTPLDPTSPQVAPPEDTPSESTVSKLNRRSFKEKLQQDGEVILYKQLYAMKERYELNVVDFSNILANFISALTSGNYPPKRRRKLSEVEKLRLKIEQLSQQDKQELAAQLNPIPTPVSTVTMAAPEPSRPEEAGSAPF